MKCCEYTSGMLRTPCTFLRKVLVNDLQGGFSEILAPITGAPDRCMVKPVSGLERIMAARLESTARLRIVTRYFGAVEAYTDYDGGAAATDLSGATDLDGGDADDDFSEALDIDGGPAYDAPTGPLVPTDLVDIDGRRYQIRYIGNVEFRNRWLEIDIEAGVAL
jgi:hypothetical protein